MGGRSSRQSSNTPRKIKQSDFYHLTLSENVESIKREGLRMSKEGYQGPGVYGSPSLEHASGYVGGLNENVALRLKPEAMKKYGDYKGYLDDERIIDRNIKPTDLDISRDGKTWRDLTSGLLIKK